MWIRYKMSKKKNKRNKNILLTDWKDWAGVSSFSPEMQLIRKLMGDSGDLSKLITTSQDSVGDCQHKMVVVTNSLYLQDEFLIERYCSECGYKEIRFEVYHNGRLEPLTDWIECKKVE